MEAALQDKSTVIFKGQIKDSEFRFGR
jgi:hypothetical protein